MLRQRELESRDTAYQQQQQQYEIMIPLRWRCVYTWYVPNREKPTCVQTTQKRYATDWLLRSSSDGDEGDASLFFRAVVLPRKTSLLPATRTLISLSSVLYDTERKIRSPEDTSREGRRSERRDDPHSVQKLTRLM